jgi:cyclopropane fatty-acyl-phospholipid synthase-like methyltransferase
VRFLDCGCGAGEYVFALRDKYGTDAWGIEYLENKVRAAKANPAYGQYIKGGKP